MKKKILCLAMAAIMAVGIHTTAFAETLQGGSDWKVEFNGSKMSSNFTSADMKKDIFQLQPGDTMELQVGLKNTSEKDADWYMTNEVIQTLEDAQATAEGGGYTYRLTYVGADNTENVLYDSTTVGGEGASKAGEGLKQVDNSTQEYFYLGRLASGESGIVHLTVGVDGETQGNGYQLTLAKLRMNFATEKVTEGTTTTKENKVEKKVPGKNNVVTTTKRVKTGDTNLILRYCALALVCGIVCLILAIFSMNKKKKEAKAYRKKGEK